MTCVFLHGSGRRAIGCRMVEAVRFLICSDVLEG